jgi:hypothetical protein
MSRPLYPGEKAPSTHWIGDWVGPKAGLDAAEKTFLTPGLELRPLGRPARSQSLYRLRYPGSIRCSRSAAVRNIAVIIIIIIIIIIS